MDTNTRKTYQDIIWILATGIGVALVAFMVALIPIVGLVIICVPIPYAIIMSKRGKWQGIVAGIVTAGIYASMIHLYVGIIFLIMIPIALSLIEIIKLHNSTYEKITFLSATILISTMLALFIVTQFLGQNPIEYLTEKIIQLVNEHVDVFENAFNMYVQMGIIESPLNQNEIIKYIETAIKQTINYLPITAMIFSFIFASVNLYMCRFILRKIKKEETIPMLSAFSDWVLPKGTSGGFLLLFILSFLTMGINQSTGTIVFTTVSSLFVFIFSVQGLSVIDCFLKYKGLNQVLRIILLVLAIIVFNMVLYIIGILDQFINLRKKIQQNSHVV